MLKYFKIISASKYLLTGNLWISLRVRVMDL